MGRIEKIVVSTVLLLVAVILAISLYGGGVEDSPGTGPLASVPSIESPPKATSGAAQKSSIAPTSDPAGLLTMSPQTPPPQEAVDRQAPPPPPPAPPRPLAGTILLTTDGLQPSPIESLMLYAWQAGDTFAGLAQRYYGAATHAGRLRTANEGRGEQDLRPGEQIFVPSMESKAARAVAAQAEGYAGGSIYVVQQGDMLGAISQKVYGTSKKWRKIYQANQDVLSSPDAIHAGMRLRIPAE